MGFWTYVSLVLGAATALMAFVVLTQHPSRKRRLENALAGIDGFKPSQSFIAFDSHSSIAVDEDKQSICLLKLNGAGTDCCVCGYADVLSSEVFEDRVSLGRASRNGPTESPLIGSASAAILAGQVADATSVTRMDLRILIKDTKSPVHDINFLDKETKKDSEIYRGVSAKILHWHGLLALAMLRAGRETTELTEMPHTKPAEVAPPFFVADELQKLVQLRDSGALTAAEFEQQKRKLLN